jgi:autotransporter-associated beta strand repeat
MQAGTLIKAGSGTLTLKGNNTYLGTVINSGTLLVDGMHSGTSPTDSVACGDELWAAPARPDSRPSAEL